MKIVKVKFYNKGQEYFYDPRDLEIKKGYFLIVDTDDGEELVEATSDIEEISEKQMKYALKEIKRLPNRKELDLYNKLTKNIDEMFTKTMEIAEGYGIEFNIVDIKRRFDGTKTTIYYTADGRIDFRELVKDLAQLFRSRIEMRQISHNVEMMMAGDYGKCGRMLCCKAFLKTPANTSMKLAKDQNITLTPNRVTGYCGKLMCCLKFEENVYKEKLEELPSIGSKVVTNDGSR